MVRSLKRFFQRFRKRFPKKNPINDSWINGRAKITEARVMQVLNNGLIEDYVTGRQTLQLRFYEVKLTKGNTPESLWGHMEATFAPDTPLQDAFTAAEYRGLVTMTEVNRIK